MAYFSNVDDVVNSLFTNNNLNLMIQEGTLL